MDCPDLKDVEGAMLFPCHSPLDILFPEPSVPGAEGLIALFSLSVTLAPI